MENLLLLWVSHESTPNLHRRRLEICQQLLPILEVREFDPFRMLVTRTRAGLCWAASLQQKAAWSQMRVNQMIGAEKVILAGFRDMTDFPLLR
jgi:hypothetical protein